eukprot:6481082-Pyramimonas_sp.AAC.1
MKGSASKYDENDATGASEQQPSRSSLGRREAMHTVQPNDTRKILLMRWATYIRKSMMSSEPISKLSSSAYTQIRQAYALGLDQRFVHTERRISTSSTSSKRLQAPAGFLSSPAT